VVSKDKNWLDIAEMKLMGEKHVSQKRYNGVRRK